MARPQILQRLKHGKLLCRKVFASFVETWNYIVNRIENLKGDADANPQTGHIKIDNTDPEHPIMRLVNIQDFGNGEGAEGDANAIGEEQRSIQTIYTDENDQPLETPYHQLNGFASSGYDWSSESNRTFRFEDDTRSGNPLVHNSEKSEFVIRHLSETDGNEVNYISSEIYAPHERLDSDGTGQQSLEYKQAGLQGAPKELQLYNFDDMTTSTPSTLTGGEGILVRRVNANDVFLDYMDASALRNFVPYTDVSALNNLEIVTGVKYNSNYEIEAERSRITIANNVLTITPIASQTIETIPHSGVI